MMIYTVTGSPVLVRQIPSADAKIMNVLPTGSKLYIIANEQGWLRTSSGYYVFKTDDITLDSNPAPTLARLSAQRRILSAGSVTDQIDAELVDQASAPTSNSTAQMERNSGAQPSGNDTGSMTSQEAINMTEKYKGHKVKVDSNDTCYQIDPVTGARVEVAIPASLKKDGNNSAIQSVDDRGNIVVIDENDQTFIIDGAQGVSISNATGENGTKTEYTPFELEQRAKEQRDADSFIDDIKKTFNNAIESVSSLNKLTIENTRTVFGMPFQFLPTTDPRPFENRDDIFDVKKFGRKYHEKIVTRAPVLVIQPGDPVFLRGYSDDIKSRVANEVLGLANAFNATSGKELNQLLSGGGEYYSFKLKKEEYFSCVNGACRAVAIFLGLEDVDVPGMKGGEGSIGETIKDGLGNNKLGSFNWMFESNESVGLGHYTGGVQFYINSDAQIQESFSTGSRPSQLTSKINQISDQAAEAMFVMGAMSSLGGDKGAFGAVGTVAGTAAGMAESSTKAVVGDAKAGEGGLLNSIIGNISTLLAGGKMHFPEIWADSQFGRSYNVTIKLDSPDCDPLSIYLNILVPLIHILGFVLPRSAGENTYVSPFLVRCFYKSMFHIDMGIITSCDIVKGDQGAWTQNGLPTQITIQLSIKDLYTVMTQSLGKDNNTLLSNPAQMDYLANMCGINIAPPNFGRSLKLWWTLRGPQKVIDSIVNAGSKVMTNAYSAYNNFMQPSRWRM